MVLDRFGERAEDDAGFGQLLLEGRGHRHRVDDRVHRHPAETLLLGEGDPELVEHRPQLGVDLVEARQRGLGLGGGVVDDVLVVDGSVGDVLPGRLGERQPVAVRAQAPFEQPLRLVLLGCDQRDDVLAQSRGDDVGVEIGDEAVLVLLARQLGDIARRAGHRAPPVAACRVISRALIIVSLLSASVYADRLGLMIPRVPSNTYKFYLANLT